MKKKLLRRNLVSATAAGVKDSEKLREQALRSLGGDFRWVKIRFLRQKLPRFSAREPLVADMDQVVTHLAPASPICSLVSS